jgi:hypothetical protein
MEIQNEIQNTQRESERKVKISSKVKIYNEQARLDESLDTAVRTKYDMLIQNLNAEISQNFDLSGIENSYSNINSRDDLKESDRKIIYDELEKLR